MKNIWAEQFIVRAWDIDRSKRFTSAAAFNYFEEIAAIHATELGVGEETLLKSNQGWILSRMSVVLHRRPEWGESITVRTWPRGAYKLFAVRDYDILDTQSITIAQGRSAWLLMDIQKLKPLRPQILTDKLPQNEGLDALIDGIGTLESRNTMALTASRKAAYSDIDYNGHVNNARYIQWIQDIIPYQALENAHTIRIDINYIAETKIAQIVDLYCGTIDAKYNWQQEQSFAIEGQHSDTKQVSFRAEIRMGG
jgi:acyl-ACP thioesterase